MAGHILQVPASCLPQYKAAGTLWQPKETDYASSSTRNIGHFLELQLHRIACKVAILFF
jgi:hypothetical protein